MMIDIHSNRKAWPWRDEEISKKPRGKLHKVCDKGKIKNDFYRRIRSNKLEISNRDWL